MSKRRNEAAEIPSLEQISAEQVRIRKKTRFRSRLRATFITLVLVVAVAFLVATQFVPIYRIVGNSMSPSLAEGDFVLCFKTADLERGDLAAFYYGNKLLIKRVIGQSADWIEIEEDGTVSVNTKELDEPYLSEKALGTTDLEYPYQVPDAKWFVMGDNRSTSVDSRSTQIGCISEEQMIGKIFYRIWPLNKIGPVG